MLIWTFKTRDDSVGTLFRKTKGQDLPSPILPLPKICSVNPFWYQWNQNKNGTINKT